MFPNHNQQPVFGSGHDSVASRSANETDALPPRENALGLGWPFGVPATKTSMLRSKSVLPVARAKPFPRPPRVLADADRLSQPRQPFLNRRVAVNTGALPHPRVCWRLGPVRFHEFLAQQEGVAAIPVLADEVLKTRVLAVVTVVRGLGFQADMAHTLLYTLGYNAPEDRILPE